MEVWKDIDGFKGIYEVSNYGRIRTHKDRTIYTVQGKRRLKQKYLKSDKRHPNYEKVTLHKEGKRFDFYVHRLVAAAFLKPVDGLDQINHLDGNKRNNHISNLEWSNNSLNAIHAFDNGLHTSIVGVKLKCLSDNVKMSFNTVKDANTFLGRSTGYIHRRIQLNFQTVVSKTDNKIYEFELVR